LFFRVGSNPNEVAKRMKRQSRSKSFKVEITYLAKIPLQEIEKVVQGQEFEHHQEVLKVLDVILSQNATNQYVQINIQNLDPLLLMFCL
jgi:eukaryotic translation initiation factor 2C